MAVRKYTNPFLKDVIVRIDFSDQIEEFDYELPKDIETLITKVFPISDHRKTSKTRLKLSQVGENQEIEKYEESIVEWKFKSRDRKELLVIGSLFMYISTSHYQSFEILFENFMEIVSKIFEYKNTLSIRRFGLRYMNEINLNSGKPTYWVKHLNGTLLSSLNLAEDPNQLARAFTNVVFNYGDIKLRFQYGMHNPDFPAPIRKKIFVLDLDAYYEGIIEDSRELGAIMIKSHEFIEILFEKSIKDPLREIMGEIKNADQ